MSRTDLSFIESPLAVPHAAGSISNLSVLCRTLEEKGDWKGLIKALGSMYPFPFRNDADTFYWCAVAHLRTGQPKLARKLLLDAVELYEDKNRKADCLSRIAESLWQERRLERTDIFISKALELADDPYTIVVVRINAGIIAAAKGDLQASLDECANARPYVYQVDTPYITGLFNLRFGNAYHKPEFYTAAIRYYELALPCFEELDHLPYQALTHNNLAHAYLKLSQLEESIFHIKQAGRLANEVSTLKRIAETYGEIVEAMEGERISQCDTERVAQG